MRTPRLGVPFAAAAAFAAASFLWIAPAAAEPAGDDPIVTALVSVWSDADANGLYGTQGDLYVGNDLTDTGGRWDVDIAAFPGHDLGAVAVIPEYLLRHPYVCFSETLIPWSGKPGEGQSDKCWGIGGDLFADGTHYLDGVRVQAILDANFDGVYGPIPFDVRLAPDTLTHPIAPGDGDYRFYDIQAAMLGGNPIGIVIHVGQAAAGRDVLSGRLWEPSQRQQ